IFLLRVHKLSQDGDLPEKYHIQKLSDLNLDSIDRMIEAMRLIDSSNINELNNLYKPVFDLLKNKVRDDKDRRVVRALFMLLQEKDYSKNSFDEGEFGELFSSIANQFLSDPYVGGEYVSSSLTQSLFANINLSKGNSRILDPTFGIGNTAIQ